MWGNTSIFCMAPMIRSRRDRVRAFFAKNAAEVRRPGRPFVILRSLALFVLAGLCEIGGGYLVWQWWRNGAPRLVGVLGAAVLVLYGIVPTYQPQHFGRVYAAYGGMFVVLSILWGWSVDRIAPDRFDLLGGALCLAGVFVVMYWPM